MEFSDLPEEAKKNALRKYSLVNGQACVTFEEIFNLCMDSLDVFTDHSSLVVCQDGDYLMTMCDCGEVVMND
jgi:hypothetical protein